jgi:ribosomal-protein-alanine N-acetyltransferase
MAPFDPHHRNAARTYETIYRLDDMTQDYVAEFTRVERLCFPNPWPASAYRRELQNPSQNHYVVLREQSVLAEEHTETTANGSTEKELPATRGLPRRSLLPIAVSRRHDGNGTAHSRIIGFAGMWMAFDEAHVTTIGVAPQFRGRGLGELLLLSMFDEAMARGANWLTLEVRVSNAAAQTLYRKYGFSEQGVRKRYYSDNNEDALIMSSRPLTDPEFRDAINDRRAALRGRLAAHLDQDGLAPLTGSWRKASAQ